MEQRFARIAVVGEEKYGEIFRNNPRVAEFVPFADFDAGAGCFDEVYCGVYNKSTGLMRHMRVG